MLINWMASSMLQQQQSHQLAPKNSAVGVSSPTTLYNQNDHQHDIMANNFLIQQFCTNLLVAGVIKQIPDKYAPLQDSFRVSEQIILLILSSL